MKRYVDGLVLYEGTVRDVRFSPSKEKAFLEFDEDGMVFEFRNGKRGRADHIRKLKVLAGERVVAIGAKSGTSPLYAFGYDLQRAGKVKNLLYLILRGKVLKTVKMKKEGFIYLDGDKAPTIIKAKLGMVEHVEEGMPIACLCYQETHNECNKTCKEWNLQKCSLCKHRQSEKRFVALEML